MGCDYKEIIELEVLNGIDKAFHAMYLEFDSFPCDADKAKIIKPYEDAVSELKKTLSDYIDAHLKSIVFRNLNTEDKEQ